MTVPPSPLDPLARQTSLLQGLRRYTAYNVTVLCFTSPGDGVRSAPVAVATLEDGEAARGGMHLVVVWCQC